MDGIRKETDWGWGTDAYPGQGPQEQQFQEDRAEMSQMPAKSQDYKWIVSGKNLVVVSPDRLDNAYASLGIERGHKGPYATGNVSISHRWTTSFVVDETNVDLDYLYKLFQKWAKYPQINFEDWNHPLYVATVQDKNGIPLPVGVRTAADPGVGNAYPDKLWVKTDDDLRTDHQRNYPGMGDMKAEQERITTEPYQCPRCMEVFNDYIHLVEHMTYDHPKGDLTGPEYEIRDNDETFYPDNEMSRKNGEPGFYASVKEEDAPEGPIPFSFDINEDRIFVGQPGDEGVEMDESNPFGVVEGYYTPDGDLLIVNEPTISYAIRHLKNLWQNIYPEYPVKHIYVLEIRNGKRIRERVANNGN